MNIAIASAWRNMTGRINRYHQQVAALEEHLGPGHKVRTIAVEGDSEDGTAEELQHFARLWQRPTAIVNHHHGGPRFASTEHPDRLEALSGVLAAGMAAVCPEDDVLIWVESDLHWSSETFAELAVLAAGRQEGMDIVAPLIFAGQNFYDVWGFRGIDGERFGPGFPYHSTLPAQRPPRLTEVHSVGSCLAMGSEVARSVDNAGNTEALVGWCSRARAAGYRIGVAQHLRIHHPA